MDRWLSVPMYTLIALLILSAASVDARGQSPTRHKWWQSDEVKALLKLSTEQVASLDEIYGGTQAKQRESIRHLRTEETTLSKIIAEMSADEIDVIRQIDRVEAARSKVRKNRTLMVFRMYRVLSLEQRARLKSWRTQAVREHTSKPSQPRCH